MKGIGILLVLAGIASFVLPLLHVQIALLDQAAGLRPLIAGILILLGGGLFFFSSYD